MTKDRNLNSSLCLTLVCGLGNSFYGLPSLSFLLPENTFCPPHISSKSLSKAAFNTLIRFVAASKAPLASSSAILALCISETSAQGLQPYALSSDGFSKRRCLYNRIIPCRCIVPYRRDKHIVLHVFFRSLL